MPDIFKIVLFMFIGCSVLFLLHYYFWRKLIKNTLLSPCIKTAATCMLILLAVLFPVTAGISYLLPFKQAFPLIWIAYLWLGSMLVLFCLLLILDLFSMQCGVVSKVMGVGCSEIDLGRRRFVARSVALGASLSTSCFSFVGVSNYYAKATVNRIEVHLTGLPDLFKGFTIVQISDLHIGRMMTGTRVQEIVDQVNDLQPDLIAITGDLVDGRIDKLLDEATALRGLKAPHGVYFVTGNHEYYSGVEDWTAEIRKMGITVLNNENVKIQRKDEWFCLAGVTDHEAKKFGKQYASDFDKALSDLEKTKTTILLAHQPIAVKEASEYGVDLVLAGHTHGGQVWPFNYLVYLQQPYVKGFHQYENTQLYINQGTGCWGPPLRINSYNEITEMILV